jgi:hypothetical protein
LTAQTSEPSQTATWGNAGVNIGTQVFIFETSAPPSVPVLLGLKTPAGIRQSIVRGAVW